MRSANHACSSDCRPNGVAIEVGFCEVEDLWTATVHAMPTQMTLWPDETDAVVARAEGIHTAVKSALRLWLSKEASLRAAAARARLRSL